MRFSRFLSSVLISITLLLCGGMAMAQVPAVPISNPSITTYGINYVFTGSSVGCVATKTVTNGAADTVWLKVIGGNHNNALHFWNIATKVSGTTDSVVCTIYGIVDTGNTAPTTGWKSLFADRTANSSSAQVFEHIIANDYTYYMIITARDGTAAQVSTWKKKVLIR